MACNKTLNHKTLFRVQNDVFIWLCWSSQKHHLQSALALRDFVSVLLGQFSLPIQGYRKTCDAGQSLRLLGEEQTSTWPWPFPVSHSSKSHWSHWEIGAWMYPHLFPMFILDEEAGLWNHDVHQKLSAGMHRLGGLCTTEFQWRIKWFLKTFTADCQRLQVWSIFTQRFFIFIFF